MYEIYKQFVNYDESINSASPSDITDNTLINNEYIENVEYYTIATATSSGSQESLLLLDIRNILVIGFICLFILLMYYHVKSTIISYLN